MDPTSLTAHPLNARLHPDHQRRALRESLSRVGWVDVVKVNTRTGNVVDGHARVEEALTAGETVPVLWVDLDPEQERYVLATLDPIAALAAYDSEVLDSLLEGLDTGTDAVAAMLKDLTSVATGTIGVPAPPPDLDDLDDQHDPSVFWPIVKVKVDPEMFPVWEEHVARHGGDEPAAFEALLAERA